MNTLGRHILVELFDCDGDKLNDVAGIESSMVAAATESGATVINSTFHHFSPFGVSGVVVIQESHLAIHTWPEYGYAAVDLFTCGDVVNPWVAFDSLKKAFGAGNGSAMELLRGQIEMLRRVGAIKVHPGDMEEEEAAVEAKFSRNVWFTDRDDNQALSLRHKGDVLFREKSDFQLVEVFDTYEFGKMLAIDKMVMTTEHDEFVYHEMISHVPMSLKKAKRILIIGGGDGGTAREVLRYSEVEAVDMVEIDEAVVRASKEHLPQIAASFDDPRLNLTIGDGIAYVANAKAETYDLVIVDGSDPVGPAEGLFSEEFYRNIQRALKPDGMLVAQAESPFFNKEAFAEIFACYNSIFGAESVHPYLAHIPTYPSGTWAFALAVKDQRHPVRDLDQAVADANSDKFDLKYYDGSIHHAAFAIPKAIRARMGS